MTPPLTVVCVWVQGEYPYTVEYVRRLLAMVRRWMDRPFRFVCLTDRPEQMPDGVEAMPIATVPGLLGFWAKVELFNPARGFTGRMLYLDLDSLIVGPLAPVVDVDAPFALIADPPRAGQRTHDRFRRQIVRRFNSSVMVWNGGDQTALYETWSPSIAARLSGDQDHIGEQAPSARGLDPAWFPRISQVSGPPFGPDVKVILAKYPKNDVVAGQVPWFGPLWGAA